MKTVGDKIRLQRLTKNYSQEYMAFMLTISQPAYSKIERGETDLSLKRVYDIAEVLEVDPFTLMPPSKYGTGINYLYIKQLFYKYYRLFRDKFLRRKEEAKKIDIVYRDKSNSPD